MPDRTIDLLFRFLHQNGGQLSKRAREQEFAQLTDAEADRIVKEAKYRVALSGNPELLGTIVPADDYPSAVEAGGLDFLAAKDKTGHL